MVIPRVGKVLGEEAELLLLPGALKPSDHRHQLGYVGLRQVLKPLHPKPPAPARHFPSSPAWQID